MARIQYILPTLKKHIARQDRQCPHCESANTRLLGKKYLIVQLRKCDDCQLCYRWPKDRAEDNYHFYNSSYAEPNGMTTNLLDRSTLDSQLATSFSDADRDFGFKIELLKGLKQTGKLLDFGSSWGYGAYQFAQVGSYDVTGYEIDALRAEYGRQHLDLNILQDLDSLRSHQNEFDIIFSNHVLEHLPDVKRLFQDFYEMLKPRGLLMLCVPNCTGIEKKSVFETKKCFAFGEKHTIAFTAEFFDRVFPRYGFTTERIDVSPFSLIHNPAQNLLDGSELMAIASKSK